MSIEIWVRTYNDAIVDRVIYGHERGEHLRYLWHFGVALCRAMPLDGHDAAMTGLSWAARVELQTRVSHVGAAVLCGWSTMNEERDLRHIADASQAIRRVADRAWDRACWTALGPRAS